MSDSYYPGTTMRAALIFLWLLGTEVLPNLHLGTHQADHTHEANGTIISHGDADEAELERLHQLAHERSGRPCLHEKPKQQRKQNQLAFDRVAHAAVGIAHHATALLDPPLPITTAVSAPHVQVWRHAEPNARLASVTAARPSARGPPLA